MRDHDSAELAFRIKAATWAGAAAFMVVAGGAIVVGYAKVSFGVILLAAAGLFVIVYFTSITISEKMGATGARIFAPSGSTTPPKREYSLADALVAHGKLNEAAEAYELLAEDHPDDPEPPTRLARLLRDQMARFEDAVTWFRKALAVEGIPSHTEIALLRELIELYTHKLRQPNKALPYLARLAEKHAGTPAAQWARAEAAEIRQAMRASELND